MRKTRSGKLTNASAFKKFINSKEWQLYAMIMVPAISLLIFAYVPMAGIRMAFIDYKVSDGIFGSSWADPWYYWFQRLFKDPEIYKYIWNTLKIASLKVFIGFPIPIIVSLLLNEMGNKFQKRTIQTLIYLPYFLSWIVLSTLIFEMFGSQGSLSKLFGGLNIFTDGKQFVIMVVASDLWKGFGFSTVIYLASLTGIDHGLYEAAELDGANRFKQTIFVTIPGIMPIVMLNFILNLGNILNAGFEQIYALYNPLVYESAEIIDTYVYKLGILQSQEELSTAVSLFKGVIGATLVVTVNVVATKVTDYRVF